MHSSQWVTNPVIWISHEEFREVVRIAMQHRKTLADVAKGILTSNLKIMEETPQTIHYMKSMKTFREARKSNPKNYRILNLKK